jgi:hypothetical protein
VRAAEAEAAALKTDAAWFDTFRAENNLPDAAARIGPTGADLRKQITLSTRSAGRQQTTR